VFEVNLSWVPIRGTQSREVYSSCVEDVVIDVFNRVEESELGQAPGVQRANTVQARSDYVRRAELQEKALV